MLRSIFGTLLVASIMTVSTGCADQGGETVGRYVDGESVMTDDGAFKATLFHEEGEVQVGENDFFVRVAVPNPNNPTDEGKGLARARVSLDAAMLDSDHVMTVEPEVEYEGDGVYEIEGVLLDRAGDWVIDVDIELGNIHERATFAFTVEG